MDRAPIFRYRALNDPRRDIRLLKLLDTDDISGFLAFELAVFNLDGVLPEFAAISYTWGLSQRTESIIVNGLPLQIRRAAWELLVAIKRLSSDTASLPAYLWIDSICINQGNIRERSLQVQLMRKLYSTAKLVVVWLGAPTPGSDLAMQRLANLTQRRLQKKSLRRQSGHTLEPFQHASTSTLYGPNATGFDYAYRGDPDVLRMTLDAKIGDSILYLFRRRYWHRIWVIQEVLLAKDVLLLCGSKSIQWGKLSSFFGGLEYQRLVEGLRFHGSTRIAQIMKTSAYKFVRERSYFESNPRLKAQGASISDLLQSFGNFECADKRDKIYGILGLSGDAFDVNYAKSLPQLHNEVLQRVVRTAQMDSIPKAEAFSRSLAAALGVSSASEQLVKASDLFYTPPRALRWTDPRPFWETDFARALPQSYLHHLTSMLALSMTPARARLYPSLAPAPSTSQGSMSHDALASMLADQFLNNVDTIEANLNQVSGVTFEADAIALSEQLPDIRDVDPIPLLLDSYNAFDVTLPRRSADDSDIRADVTHHVDYLSHDWDQEDLHANWKHISTQKDRRSSRFENAIWRTWNKIIWNCSTVSPSDLNWLKEVDVTWLYGPFVAKSTATMPRVRILQQRPDVAEALKEARSPRVSRGRPVRFQDAVQVVNGDGTLEVRRLETKAFTPNDQEDRKKHSLGFWKHGRLSPSPVSPEDSDDDLPPLDSQSSSLPSSSLPLPMDEVGWTESDLKFWEGYTIESLSDSEDGSD